MKIFISFFFVSVVSVAITSGAPTERIETKTRGLIPSFSDLSKLPGLSSLSGLFGSSNQPGSGDPSKLPSIEKSPLEKLKLFGLPNLPGPTSPNNRFGSTTSPQSGDPSKQTALENLPSLLEKLKLPGLPSLADLSKLPGFPKLPDSDSLSDLRKIPGLTNPGLADDAKHRGLNEVGQFILKIPGFSALPGFPNFPLPTLLVRFIELYYSLLFAWMEVLEKAAKEKPEIMQER